MSTKLPLPHSVKIKASEGNRAVLEIEGLYPGYGTTIGNALRRVLLSSLSGAAITSFQIHGVSHEFSTVPGVLEDMVEISLNLKRIRMRLFSDEPQKLVLKKKGEGEVRASDFERNSNVEIVNPEYKIATITAKGGTLELEASVDKGVGYLQVGESKKEKLPIGVVAIDAIFTPIKTVNFDVENMRVGDRTDYNRVLINIETDGTLSPAIAAEKAARILLDHFKFIHESLSQEEDAGGVQELSREESEDIMKMKVDELNIPRRAVNALNKAGVENLEALLKKNGEELLALEGMGDKAMEEVKKSLQKLGYSLKD